MARYKALLHFGLPEPQHDVQQWRSMSRPLEQGKVLYCLGQPDGREFIELVAWAGIGACDDDAKKKLVLLLDAVVVLREVTTRRVQSKSVQQKVAKQVAAIESLLRNNGDFAAGCAAAKRAPDSSVTAVSPKYPSIGAQSDHHTPTGKKRVACTDPQWNGARWMEAGWDPSSTPRIKTRLQTKRSCASAHTGRLQLGSPAWRERLDWYYKSNRGWIVHPRFEELAAMAEAGSKPNKKVLISFNRLGPHFDGLNHPKEMTAAVGGEANGAVNRVVAYVHTTTSDFACSVPDSITRADDIRSYTELVAALQNFGSLLTLKDAEVLRAAKKLKPQPTTSALRDAKADKSSRERWLHARSDVGEARRTKLFSALEVPASVRSLLESRINHFSSRASVGPNAFHVFGESIAERKRAMQNAYAALALLRCLIDFKRRRTNKIACEAAVPHTLWFLERSCQGPFVVVRTLIRRWRRIGMTHTGYADEGEPYLR